MLDTVISFTAMAENGEVAHSCLLLTLPAQCSKNHQFPRKYITETSPGLSLSAYSHGYHPCTCSTFLNWILLSILISFLAVNLSILKAHIMHTNIFLRQKFIMMGSV